MAEELRILNLAFRGLSDEDAGTDDQPADDTEEEFEDVDEPTNEEPDEEASDDLSL